MRLGVQLFLLGLSALGLIFFSLVESAYEETSDVALRMVRGETRSGRRETFFIELMENRVRFRMTVMLGLLLSAIGLAVVLHVLVLSHFVGRVHLYSFVFAVAAAFLASQFLPRFITRSNPLKVLLALMPLYKPYYRVASLVVAPFTWMLERTSSQQEEAAEEPEADDVDMTMSDIQALIEMGEEEGIIEEADGVMIQSIVEFGDRVVSEVMTPRAQMVAITSLANVREARDLIVAAKHSRLPVYGSDVDEIEGMLYVRDLVAAWAEGKELESVTAIMRTAYFVPEVKPVADLLEEMRKSKVQIAVVIDEYGSVAGLVTIEDLLEEIVGEIEDEDVEAAIEDDIVFAEDGSVVVKGSAEIRKIEVQFDAELEADDFSTVAGLIISELGHVPVPGETLRFRGLEFEVVEADSSRVRRVRLRRLPKENQAMSQEASEIE